MCLLTISWSNFAFSLEANMEGSKTRDWTVYFILKGHPYFVKFYGYVIFVRPFSRFKTNKTDWTAQPINCHLESTRKIKSITNFGRWPWRTSKFSWQSSEKNILWSRKVMHTSSRRIETANAPKQVWVKLSKQWQIWELLYKLKRLIRLSMVFSQADG